MDDPIGSQLLFQLLLILINAFFASTETAVVSLNENRIRKQAEDGDKKAALMLHMIESPTRFLSTIQVCITLSGFLASAFAADSFASVLSGALTRAGFTLLSPAVLHTVCVVLITLILSYFMIVLGELVPKRIALKDPERIARIACPIIRGMSKFFLPLVWLLTVSTNGMLRLLRINPNDSSEEVTEEEIRMMVDIGSENGAIEQDERAMIENIFEFNNTTAADVMVHRMDVVALHVGESSEEILRTIRESGLSRFPVYDSDIDDIVGVLNTRDFLLNAQLDAPKPLRELLRRPYLVPETVPADTLFSNMQKQKTHLAIVVDEYGGMSGIVTMEDLLEEIVGNIYDEFDPEEPMPIQQISDGVWRVEGGLRVEELADVLDIDLPEDADYDTVSGMVMSCLPSIPEDGAQFTVETNGLRIRVENVQDRKVDSALVEKLQPEPAAEDERDEGDKAEPLKDRKDKEKKDKKEKKED